MNTSIPPNHYKLPEHKAFVHAKYNEELTLGCISQGFPPDILHSWVGHICTAPLNVIVQPGGKLCVTVDHSYPHLMMPTLEPHPDALEYILFDPTVHSVNAVIDSKQFQCTWGTFL